MLVCRYPRVLRENRSFSTLCQDGQYVKQLDLMVHL